MHPGLTRDVDGLFRIYGHRLYVLVVFDFLELHSDVLCEAHASRCVVHPGTAKMYHDAHQRSGPRLKRNVVDVVTKCLICEQEKAEHMRLVGTLLAFADT